MRGEVLLEVDQLSTFFKLKEGELKAVNQISFNLNRGEVLGIVGESGCGKSITSKTILRLIKNPGYSKGRILFHPQDGEQVDLLSLDPRSKQLRELRGKHISMIFQEPMNALSPVHTIGNQLMESLLLHKQVANKEEAFNQGVELLRKVGISNPEARMGEYAFQLSGGMRQRVMIAIAISCKPELLIADEPTTALDVSVQAQILKLLKDLQEDSNMAMIFITHDLSVVAQMANRIAVMYLGRIVEEGSAEDIFFRAAHPYTRKLLESLLDPGKEYSKEKLLTIEGNVPEPINLPEQCYFYDRCEIKKSEKCNCQKPEMVEIMPRHFVACHLYK